jgi:hypothetical protein
MTDDAPTAPNAEGSDATQPAATRTREERIDGACDLIRDYGDIDGAHHKQWLLDQVLRMLCVDNDEYSAWVAAYETGSDGPYTYEWDVGRAP